MDYVKAIKQIMEKAALNESTLATLAGISEPVNFEELSKMQTSGIPPSNEFLEKIAAAFETDVAFIHLLAIEPDKDMTPGKKAHFHELFPNFHETLLTFVSSPEGEVL